MRKLLTIVGSIYFLTSCGYKLSSDNSIKDLLINHTIFINGNMEFNDDGTFSLIPQSLKDPTRKYKGTWKLKECTNCDSKFPSRGIVIEFDNRGWITDGNSNNGFKETGYGTILKGDIRQNYKNEWEIRFESNSSGLIYDSNAGSSGEFVNGDKSFSRQLEDK